LAFVFIARYAVAFPHPEVDRFLIYPTPDEKPYVQKASVESFQTAEKEWHVVVLIPVYKELYNGNIQRLLRSFAEQDAPAESYSLVFVVNHRPNEHSSAATSNFRALKLLNRLKLGGTLEEFQAEFLGKNFYQGFDSAIAKKMQVRTVDLATHGIERNIGKVRNIGFLDIKKIYGENRAAWNKTVVTMFDADSRPVEKDFIRTVQHTFASTDAGVMLTGIQFHLGEQESAFDLSPTFWDQELDTFHYYLNFALRGSVYRNCTPRISVRATALDAIGGIPEIDYAEDADLIKKLHEKFPLAYVWQRNVSTADRARPEGYDAADRHMALEKGMINFVSSLFSLDQNYVPNYENLTLGMRSDVTNFLATQENNLRFKLEIGRILQEIRSESEENQLMADALIESEELRVKTLLSTNVFGNPLHKAMALKISHLRHVHPTETEKMKSEFNHYFRSDLGYSEKNEKQKYHLTRLLHNLYFEVLTYPEYWPGVQFEHLYKKRTGTTSEKKCGTSTFGT